MKNKQTLHGLWEQMKAEEIEYGESFTFGGYATIEDDKGIRYIEFLDENYETCWTYDRDEGTLSERIKAVLRTLLFWR